MIERPEPRAASALSIPALFDAIAAASHKDCKEGRPAGGDCPVCMQDASSDTIALPCGHAFHRRCIVSWLQLNSSCPCCRAPVPPSKPYRYPAKTKLQNPLLRARVEGIGLNMREVALLTSHLEGPSVFLCVVGHAAPLAPVPVMAKDGPPRDLAPEVEGIRQRLLAQGL